MSADVIIRTEQHEPPQTRTLWSRNKEHLVFVLRALLFAGFGALVLARGGWLATEIFREISRLTGAAARFLAHTGGAAPFPKVVFGFAILVLAGMVSFTAASRVFLEDPETQDTRLLMNMHKTGHTAHIRWRLRFLLVVLLATLTATVVATFYPQMIRAAAWEWVLVWLFTGRVFVDVARKMLLIRRHLL